MTAGILYSRTLGPEGMGQYELFRSTSILAATLFTLGVGNANIYFLNNRKIPRPAIVTNSVKLAIVMGIALCLGLTVVFMGFPGYFGTVSVPVAIFFAAGVGCLLTVLILRPVLTAGLDVKRMIWVDLIQRITLLAGGAASALLGLLRPQLALVVLSAASMSGCILVLLYLRADIKMPLPFDWQLYGDVLGYGLKLAASNILMVATMSLTLMLLRYLRAEDFGAVGLYSRAVAVSSLVSLVPITIGPLLFAKWSGEPAEVRTRQAEMATRLNVLYGATAAVGVVAFGKYIIWLMYGEEFIGAQDALQILGPALVFLTLFDPSNNLLAGGGRAAITAWILAGELILVCVVTWLTVPSIGIRGAALGVLCGKAFSAILALAVCQRLYGLDLRHCFVANGNDLAYVRRGLFR
jgi:O-antigen/teichoic acid export membrane protein